MVDMSTFTAPTTLNIRERLCVEEVDHKCNDNIAGALEDGDLEVIEARVRVHVEGLLRALIIDVDNDPNTKETSYRVARMLVHEAFAGRYQPAPRITDFPNAKNLDEIYTVGPITVRSMCAHHLLPITGEVWVAVKPTERVIGLSKFTRLARWVMARPHIQEEAVIMLADTIETLIRPAGLAVVIRAEHSCMTWRGVNDPGTKMVNSVMRGFFRDNPAARAELMGLLQGQGF